MNARKSPVAMTAVKVAEFTVPDCCSQSGTVMLAGHDEIYRLGPLALLVGLHVEADALPLSQ